MDTRDHRWGNWLGLNSSTLALLGAIMLVTAGTELWSPLIPQYLKALQRRVAAGDVMIVLLIGAYGFYRDALEAVNYYAMGVVSQHRRHGQVAPEDQRHRGRLHRHAG